MATKCNEEVLQTLISSDYNVRDKFLQEIKFFYEDFIPCLKLSFSNHNGERIIYELEFRELVRFDLYFEKYGPGYIEDYKIAILNNGQYYFSLDPDMAVREVSDDDCSTIIAKAIKLKLY